MRSGETLAETNPARAGEPTREVDAPMARERFVRGLLLALLLIAATVAAYQQVWRAGFIWDDDIYVTTNKLLTAPDGLKRIWLSLDSPSQYFPLVYTSFRIEHALWGLNPTGYHWVNLALHIANVLLLWRLLSLLRLPGAWLAAALFALHPVQVESVAWIAERKNVLMGFFYLLALLAWVKFAAGKHRNELKFYGLALLCYLLALFSKTTACTLPAALLLISWLKRGAISSQRVAQISPFVLLGAGMGFVSLWWERYHQGTQGEVFAIGWAERFLVAARAFWFYLGKLVWPADLAFSYPRWAISVSDPTAYMWVGACLLLVLLLWLTRRWLGRGPETAALYFAATLAPTLGFIMLYTFRYSFVADHYQYLASIGPFALGAAAITTAVNPLGRLKSVVLPLLCCALLIPLGLRTWRQGAVYQSEETLWRTTIEANPGSWMAYNNLGIRQVAAGQIDEAVTNYTKAIELNPSYTEAYYNLGNAFARKGEGDMAIMSYTRAVELYPRLAVAHGNLATVLLGAGQSEEAIAHLKEAVKIEPRQFAFQQALGEALLRVGRVGEGIEHLLGATELEPSSITAHTELAAAYTQFGDMERAIGQWEEAVKINDQDAMAQEKLGILLADNQRPEEGLPHLRKVVELDPTRAEAHYNLANIFSQVRRHEEAITEYREALRIRNDYPAAHHNLANALAESGRLEDAVAEYNLVLELRPNNVAAHKNLATTLRWLDRPDEAQSHLDQAAKIEAERH